MSKASFLVRSVMWILLLLVASCTWGPQQFYDNGVPDKEYVDIAREHPHAQAFLEKYPSAETYVDRSARLAVDFRVAKRPVASTTPQWEGIRLRVFIDPKTNQPTETFIQCNDTIVKSNVQATLDQYFTTQTCP